MDWQRLIALAMIAEQVDAWLTAKVCLAFFQKNGMEISEDMWQEAAKLDMELEGMMMTADGWISGEA